MNLDEKLFSKDKTILIIALFLGIINGLIYVFLMPPWQHYDEPNHFEYGWLIAKRGALPKMGDYDQDMRREMAISMKNHGFFKGNNLPYDLNPPQGPIWIGPYQQLSNRPFYYLLTAIPLRLFPIHDATAQLYAMRLVSLLLYLSSIVAGWGITKLLTSAGNPLRLLVPGMMALLPGYTELMTAVNNDVGAIAFFSLALWGCVWLVKRGFSFLQFLMTLVLVFLCYWTKETAYLSLPILIISLPFSLARKTHQRWVWISFGIAGFALALATLQWGDAAGWYRSTSQASNTRALTQKATAGSYAFALESRGAVMPSEHPAMFQIISLDKNLKPGSKVFTLGAWIWASEAVQAHTPIASIGNVPVKKIIDLGTEPTFFSIAITLPENGKTNTWVGLSPFPARLENNVTVYYDGLVFVEGDFSQAPPPTFSDASAVDGEWGVVKFTNLVMNPSAETGSVHFRPWLDDLGVQHMPDRSRPTFILTYLQDWKHVSWFYAATMNRLFRTFWGLFGWANVPLLLGHPYRILAILCALAVAGFVFAIWRKRTSLILAPTFIVAISFLGVWGLAFVRSVNYIILPVPYFPVARYAFPAVISTVLVLCIGWFELSSLPERWLRAPSWLKYLPIPAILFWLNANAVYSITQFFYR